MSGLSPEILTFGAGLLAGIALLRIASRTRASDLPIAPLRPAAPVPQIADRFEELIDVLDIGVVLVDRRGYITSLNGAALALIGADERASGRALIEVVPSIPMDHHVAQALDGKISRGRIDLVVEGETRRLSVVASPLGTGGAMLVASDITRVLALESIRRDFVSNVSHELRTPLSSIKLMAETILAEPGDEEAAGIFLPKILHEINRMVALVQDLLELARTEAGELHLRRAVLDIRALVNGIFGEFDQRARAQGVVLHSDPGDPLLVDGDRDRLVQIFVNLLENAIRHTARGGSVSVSARREGNMALVSIVDTGVGIPFNDLGHVFERFYVVDRSRAREVGGTGLGLSIVKQLSEAHGGYVSVESVLGHGATFTCAIPASP